MQVKYDKIKHRLISGGFDQHLKFFDATSFKVVYSIKTPSEVVNFDISPDGYHYALGLNDTSLIIRSKKDLMEKEEDLEEKMYKLEQNLQSTSKPYKYFFRGQYVKPSAEDITLSEPSKKVKLSQFDKHLKAFEYKQALNAALAQKNPETIVGLLEEFVDRGVLELALSGRSPVELQSLLQFIKWKSNDHRFGPIL